jgi:hypothetical protein
VVTVPKSPRVAPDAIAAERRRQDEQWGGPAHDDRHSGQEWRTFIALHAARGNLVQVAALGWAVSEALDRARAELARLYGEEGPLGDLAGLAEHVRDNGPVVISHDGTNFIVASEWGQEAPDSPMAAAAAYGCDEDLATALAQVVGNG